MLALALPRALGRARPRQAGVGRLAVSEWRCAWGRRFLPAALRRGGRCWHGTARAFAGGGTRWSDRGEELHGSGCVAVSDAGAVLRIPALPWQTPDCLLGFHLFINFSSLPSPYPQSQFN